MLKNICIMGASGLVGSMLFLKVYCGVCYTPQQPAVFWSLWLAGAMTAYLNIVDMGRLSILKKSYGRK